MRFPFSNGGSKSFGNQFECLHLGWGGCLVVDPASFEVVDDSHEGFGRRIPTGRRRSRGGIRILLPAADGCGNLTL